MDTTGWVVVLVGGSILAFLLIKYIAYVRDKCPKCGRRGWRCWVTPKEIEGTRRTHQRTDSRGQEIKYQVADFKVTYVCRYCDYSWTQRETREV